VNNSLIDMRNVSLEFAQTEKSILKDISYKIYAKDFIIIVGSNGSGKSSLLKIINKTFKMSSGTILLDGKSINDYLQKTINRMVKTITQNCHESLFMSLSILENYILIKQQYEPNLFSMSYKAERDFLSEYLLSFNAKLSLKLNQSVEQLSGGEKQALVLALTMLYPPRILLLDEHTSALDPKAADKLMRLTKQLVEQHNITCLLTTHDLLDAKHYGNRILALRNGVIHHTIEQEVKMTLTQQALLSACY